MKEIKKKDSWKVKRFFKIFVYCVLHPVSFLEKQLLVSVRKKITLEK